MRRTRSPCCARASSGHALLKPIPTMNSRRRIARPRAETAAIQVATRTIKSGNYGGRNGVKRSSRGAPIPRTVCLTWVKSGRDALKFRCPLYPRKRTFSRALGMSATGQQQTSDQHTNDADRHRWLELSLIGRNRFLVPFQANAWHVRDMQQAVLYIVWLL
jgi:hypothetical protein